MTTTIPPQPSHSPPSSINPPPGLHGSHGSSATTDNVTRDWALVSELPASRVNAAITRMLNGVRLSSALWSDGGRHSTGGHDLLQGRLGGGGISHRNRPVDDNMYRRSGYYDSPSSRSRLLRRYSERGYEGVNQPRRTASLRQKSEHTSQRLKECLVDEVADNLREQIGLLQLGVEPGRSASGSLARFNQLIDAKERERKGLEPTSHDNLPKTRSDSIKDDNNKCEGLSTREDLGRRGGKYSSGDDYVDIERVNPKQRPMRVGESPTFHGVSSEDPGVNSRNTIHRDSDQHVTITSPLYIPHDEGLSVEHGEHGVMTNNSSKQRRSRTKIKPNLNTTAGVEDKIELGGSTSGGGQPTMEYGDNALLYTLDHTGGASGDPNTQFSLGFHPGESTTIDSSIANDNSSLFKSRSDAEPPTASEANLSSEVDRYHSSLIPVIRGVPQSPSQTTIMIRDKRVPPMPSGRPPPLPQHLKEDLSDSQNTSLEEDVVDQIPVAIGDEEEEKLIYELGVVPDGVSRVHLPLLRAKKVFEKELATRLEQKMESEDKLLGDLRLCMEKPSLNEKVESTMRVVQDVIKTNIIKNGNGNRIYSVELDLGRFYRKVKHDINDYVVEIEGSTFGSPESSLSKVINVEFPDTVDMEKIVFRQLGPTIEIEVPFKPTPIMNDLIDLVSKMDADKEREFKATGKGGSVSSDQNSVSSSEQEQPPHLPMSPPPLIPLKQPKPMRRRKRNNLARSNSSDSLPSMKDRSESPSSVRSGVVSPKPVRDLGPKIGASNSTPNKTVKKNITTYIDKQNILHDENNNPQTARNKTRLSKSGSPTLKGSSHSGNKGKGLKSIKVDQTSSVFAPEEHTLTRLEFDDDEYLTMRHVPIPDDNDKSETDSGIAMEKKISDDLSNEVSLTGLTDHESGMNIKHKLVEIHYGDSVNTQNPLQNTDTKSALGNYSERQNKHSKESKHGDLTLKSLGTSDMSRSPSRLLTDNHEIDASTISDSDCQEFSKKITTFALSPSPEHSNNSYELMQENNELQKTKIKVIKMRENEVNYTHKPLGKNARNKHSDFDLKPHDKTEGPAMVELDERNDPVLAQNEPPLVGTLTSTPSRNSVDLGKDPDISVSTESHTSQSGGKQCDKKETPIKVDTYSEPDKSTDETPGVEDSSKQISINSEKILLTRNNTAKIGRTVNKEIRKEGSTVEMYVRPQRQNVTMARTQFHNKTDSQKDGNKYERRRQRQRPVIKMGSSLRDKVNTLPTDSANEEDEARSHIECQSRDHGYIERPSVNRDMNKEQSLVGIAKVADNIALVQNKPTHTDQSQTSKPANAIVELSTKRRHRNSFDLRTLPSNLIFSSGQTYPESVGSDPNNAAPNSRNVVDNEPLFQSSRQVNLQRSTSLKGTNRFALGSNDSKDTISRSKAKSFKKDKPHDIPISIPGSDNERVNKLRNMFENLAKTSSSPKNKSDCAND